MNRSKTFLFIIASACIPVILAIILVIGNRFLTGGKFSSSPKGNLTTPTTTGIPEVGNRYPPPAKLVQPTSTAIPTKDNRYPPPGQLISETPTEAATADNRYPPPALTIRPAQKTSTPAGQTQTTTPTIQPTLTTPTQVGATQTPIHPIPPSQITQTPAVQTHTPTEPPQPSLTPSPTQNQQPSPTPFPLVQPAGDAAGTIFYFTQPLSATGQAGLSLASIPVDGTGEATGAPSPLLINPAIDWPTHALPSPDGSYMILESSSGGGAFYYLLDLNSGKALLLLDGKPIDVFFGWHPDSQHILVNYSHALFLWSTTDVADYVRLTSPETGDVVAAAISPTGQKIVYSTSDSTGVWIVNADGSEAHLLVAYPGYGSLFWSPDGNRIAIQGGQMVINADGSGLRVLNYFHYCDRSVWSPDSRTLAIPIQTSEGTFCSQWMLVNASSSEAHPVLESDTSGILDLSWSPDGRQLAFISERSGASEVWLINADGTNLRQLTSDGQPKRFPYWRRP